MALGEPGVLHGMRSYSVAGYRWKYPAGTLYFRRTGLSGSFGPEHAYQRIPDAKYVAITDVEAMDVLMELCKLEGIIPAIESAHAIAYAFKKAKKK